MQGRFLKRFGLRVNAARAWGVAPPADSGVPAARVP